MAELDLGNVVGPAGPGVAAGGTAGQVLKKKSSTDYDTEWGNEDLGITGASVGDLVRVNAVDADGKPTSWKRAPLCEIAANPNLLDNGYFVGGGSAGQFPINQRGQASYGNAGYGIDRWKIQASGRGTVAVNSDCIRLTKTSASGGGSFQVEQTLEREVSGPLTLSALIRSSGSACSISIRDANAGNLASVTDTVSSSLHLVQATCSGSGNPAKTIRIACPSAAETDSYVEVIAIKLEIGSEQTLAHLKNGNPVLNELPNYQQELAKCQRFFQIFRTQSLRPTYGMDFRPAMASETPVLGSFTVDAVTYYSASSEP